jgi:hypothetical protein
MHQSSAVGIAKDATIDEKGLYLCAKVVDGDAWEKVREGVYKGFSIGGKSLSKEDGVITELRLSEISLVDRPANPEAVFDCWKADWAKPEEQAAVDELAKLMQGGVSATELLELAKRAAADKDLAIAALPDGTFKIVEKAHLGAALRALVLAKDFTAAKAHIVKRAEALGAADLIPTAWKVAPLKKGLYLVAQFAQVMDVLAGMQTSAAWEKEAEGDDSAVPAAMKNWIGEGCKILADMVSEETAEMMAVARVEPTGDVAKKDATVPAAAAAAPTANAPSKEDASAATAAADLSKAELAKRDEAIAAHAKTIETLEKRLKALEDQPLPPKGSVRAVDKTNDTGGGNAAAEVDPIRKADGSIDEVATEMKKVHAAGGRRLLFSN